MTGLFCYKESFFLSPTGTWLSKVLSPLQIGIGLIFYYFFWLQLMSSDLCTSKRAKLAHLAGSTGRNSSWREVPKLESLPFPHALTKWAEILYVSSPMEGLWDAVANLHKRLFQLSAFPILPFCKWPKKGRFSVNHPCCILTPKETFFWLWPSSM